MMKKKITILTALLLLVLLAVAFFSSLTPHYSSTLETNWGFPLPAKALCKQVYEADSGSSFHGDGIRYHIFSYRYEDYVDLMFAWIGTEHETLYHPSYSEAAAVWLDEINVPEDQRPNYDECFYWYRAKEDNSEIIVFWDAEENKLYTVESFL